MLADLLGERRGVAVVALGGYARRELCPSSDIDVLLVHDGWGRADLETVVQQLCYPLWDAGLSVGHAVRTPAEAVAAAAERIDTATAVLDRRLVAGDPGLLDALASRVDRWVKRQRGRLIVDLAEADRQRHARFGEHPGVLEPELKNGSGGLRDLHSLRWVGGWALGDINLDALVAAGYVGARDRRSLSVANDTLLEVRCALHLARPSLRGREADVLRLQDHDDVAALLALRDAEGRGDGDALLRRVGLATRTVAHVHGRAWPLLLADAGGRRRLRLAGRRLPHGALSEGLVDVDPPGDDDPAWPLTAIAAAAQQRAHLTRASAALVERAVRDRDPLEWNAAARRALLDVLRSRGGALTALQDADHLGVLSAYLPEWEAVRGRPQRNALHRFDLDTHGAHAISALHDLVERDDLAMLWDRLDSKDKDTLLLALWLHDVGKAWPGDHSEVGADVAQRWLNHMGFDAEVQRHVSHLVRWHLLLPDVATRRDLDDDREIAAVRDVVGDVEMLDALYLLSLADGRATGPAAWSAWKDSLMARLHSAVRARLGAPLPTRMPDARGAEPTPAQQQLIATVAPRRYVEVAAPAQLAAHAEMLLPALVDDELRASARDGGVAGTSVVSVVAQDRVGLFADCAGVFSAHELDVVEARAFTGPSGVALDWFTIDGDVEAAVLEHLVDVAAGRRSVEQLLTRRRRRSASSPAGGGEITIRDPFTVEVQAPDTPGLLYRLCTALRDLGLSVTAARISSIGPSVFDVFEVVPSIAADQAPAVERALLSAAAPAN